MMTPAEYEWQHEQTEIAYERGQIDATEFRRRMLLLKMSDVYISEMLSDLDRDRGTPA